MCQIFKRIGEETFASNIAKLPRVTIDGKFYYKTTFCISEQCCLKLSKYSLKKHSFVLTIYQKTVVSNFQSHQWKIFVLTIRTCLGSWSIANFSKRAKKYLFREFRTIFIIKSHVYFTKLCVKISKHSLNKYKLWPQKNLPDYHEHRCRFTCYQNSVTIIVSIMKCPFL